VTTATEFWADNTTAAWWKAEDARYGQQGINKRSEDYLRKNVPKDVKSICEVGAGTGRLIGMFKNIKAHSVDINSAMCDIVREKYPHVTTCNFPASFMPTFAKDSVDLVYSFQALQHIPNNMIMDSLTEMLRITKDRLWLLEGFMPDKEQGERTHKANGGSFCYYYDRIFKCESIEFLEPGIKVYKIRKKDNSTITEPRFGEK